MRHTRRIRSAVLRHARRIRSAVMRHTRRTRFAAIALLAGVLCAAPCGPLAPRPLAAQEAGDSTGLVVVHLVGGAELQGHVLDDGDPLRLRLPSGDVLEVARSRIVAVVPLEGRVVGGAVWPDDPNRTSLFLGPTARTLPAGRGYLAAYELFFPLAGIGVTDHVTLAAGAPLLSGLLDEGLVYVAPKVRVPGTGPQMDLAVGGLAFLDLQGDGTAGVVYGVLTAGSRDRSVSVAALLPWFDDEWGNQPFAMVGFEARTHRAVKWMSENYLSTDASLFTFGPRFFGDRLSADLGVAVAVDEGSAALFPIVNFMMSW